MLGNSIRRAAGAVLVALLLTGCSSAGEDDRDTSISLEQLASDELRTIPGVEEVRAVQTAVAEPAPADRSDPDLWSLDVHVSLADTTTTAQAGEAAEEVRAFMDRHHGDARWAAQLTIGEGISVDEAVPESLVQVEVWPEVHTSAAADTAAALAMSTMDGVDHVGTAAGNFELRATSAVALPDLMTALRALPAWSDGGSVQAEEGRVRIVDVPDRVTDTQLQAILAIAIAYPAADLEISASAEGDPQPVLFLNRFTPAEADAVVATLTEPGLAHVSDDGSQLDFALRSDVGDTTGTVGVPG
ncbi:hypothetical protein [Aeromicrobium sp. Sec7.5]|uniref:hypothetical protein n=1 Tax=Aeromicrobium sp. Sec7.5 TaxID=3121276 RepID=UPI002FE4DA92